MIDDNPRLSCGSHDVRITSPCIDQPQCLDQSSYHAFQLVECQLSRVSGTKFGHMIRKRFERNNMRF